MACWTVFDIRINDNHGESESVMVRNFLWKVAVEIHDKEDGQKLLTIHAGNTAQEDLRLWDFNLSANFIIHGTDGLEFMTGFTNNFGDIQKTLGADEWKRCFLQNSYVKIQMLTEIRVKNLLDSELLSKYDDDVEIKSNGYKLYANKFILAQYSQYFAENINNQSVDISDMDIPYENLCQFVDFINNMGFMIKEPEYGVVRYKEIETARYATFSEMLKISIKLKADYIRDVCIQLISTCKIDSIEFFKLACEWNVQELKDLFFGFCTIELLMEMFQHDEMDRIGEKTKAAFIDKIHELSTQNEQIIDEVECSLNLMGDKFPAETITVAGVPFLLTLGYQTHNHRIHRMIGVRCNWQDLMSPWKCRVNITINGVSRVVQFERFASSLSAFLNNQPIHMPWNIKIEVLSVQGCDQPKMTDFNIPLKSSDFIITKGDKKFYILFKYSNYFKIQFEESPEKLEGFISDVDDSEFEMLLNFIYYPNQSITDHNIVILFELTEALARQPNIGVALQPQVPQILEVHQNQGRIPRPANNGPPNPGPPNPGPQPQVHQNQEQPLNFGAQLQANGILQPIGIHQLPGFLQLQHVPIPNLGLPYPHGLLHNAGLPQPNGIPQLPAVPGMPQNLGLPQQQPAPPQNHGLN